MALVRWSPFDELESFFRTPARRVFSETWQPEVDIYEDDDSYVISAEVPGVDTKDIKINLENSTLTISGERKLDKNTKEENYRMMGRYYGSFARRFHVPTIIDREKVDASMDKGILMVTLPKKPEVKPKEIKVKVH